MPDAMSARPIFIFTFQAHNSILPYVPILKLLFPVSVSFLCFPLGQKMKFFSQADTRHQERTDASEVGSFARAEIQRNSSGTVVGCGGYCGRDVGVRPVAPETGRVTSLSASRSSRNFAGTPGRPLCGRSGL